MNEKDLKKVFDDSDSDEYLDKKTICAGLGIKKSLLDSKAVHGGGPPSIKESNKLFYKKIEAIEWHIKYSKDLSDKKEKLRVAVFSMANAKK